MGRVDKKENAGTLFALLLICLLFANTFVRTKINSIHGLGEISTNLSFALMCGFLLKSWIDRVKYKIPLYKVYTSMVLFIAVFAFSYFTTDYSDSYYFIRVISLFIFILGLVRYRWNIEQVKVIGFVSGVVTLTIVMHWVQLGYPGSLFESVFRNENYLAVLLFSMLYFNILTIKYSSGVGRAIFLLLLVINFVMMLTTGARSVLIGTAVIIFSWVVIKQYKKFFPYLIYLVLIGNGLFVTVYVGIKNTFIGKGLNQFSRELFNKNLFSGRSELWEGSFQAIAMKPWFGHGVGVNASDVTEIKLTAHNLYIQLMLEVGVIGLGIFILLILAIWAVLNRNLDSFAAKWSACFLLGILIYESFELTLFQNNYSISMFQWLIITFGINFSTPKRYEGSTLLRDY